MDRVLSIRDQGPACAPAGAMWILGKAGSAGKIRWHAHRLDESAAARSLFDHLCSLGYRGFLIGPCQPLRHIVGFDPVHRQVMLAPGPAIGWDDCNAAAWSASIEEAGGMLCGWIGRLWHKPLHKPSPQVRQQVRANREALAVLLRVLNQKQRQSLRENGCFMLVGGASGMRYRMRTAGPANIEQLDAQGAVTYRLRVAPAGELAFPGWLAMQAAHLQDAATEYPFLAAAQVFPAHE
jgi:hypothetical protein